MKLFFLRLLYIAWIILISMICGIVFSLSTLIVGYNKIVFLSAFFIGLAFGNWSCINEMNWKDLGEEDE